MKKIKTHTGLEIDLESITAEQIRIEDIAHSLSNQCMFNGHTSRFFSHAEHSYYLVSRFPKIHGIYALLSNSGKAYIDDYNISPISPIRKRVTDVILEKFSLSKKQYSNMVGDLVKENIKLKELETSLLIENKGFILSPDDVLSQEQFGLSPEEAKASFLNLFNILS